MSELHAVHSRSSSFGCYREECRRKTMPEDFTQTTDALDAGLQDTGALEANLKDTGVLETLPRTLDWRSILNERRQSILQQKQTESLPRLTNGDTANTKVAWRQVLQLREENRRLRFDLEEQRSELQRLIAEYTAMQEEFDREIAIIHNGHQQEIEHYHQHLNEMIDERNRLQDAHSLLEQRYQNLYHSFQDAAEEEAQKMVTEAAKTLELPSGTTPVLFQDVVKTVEFKVRQEEDKHLIEALYLKREVQSMAEKLQQARQQIDQERQNLLIMQNTVREQAVLRHKMLQARLEARWTMKSVCTAIGVLFLLVVMQFVFLYFLNVRVAPAVSLSILAPIVLCIVCAILFATPYKTIKHIYTGAPHRKKVKNER